jgi:hypothetical protein
MVSRIFMEICGFVRGPSMPYAILAVVLAILGLTVLWMWRPFRRYVQNALVAPLTPNAVSGMLRFLYLGRLCRLLAIFLRRKMPLHTALQTAATCFTFIPMRESLQRVAAEIERGQPLDHALKSYPQLFPATFVQFVRAALLNGQMPQTFEQLAESYEERAETQGRSFRLYVYLAAMALLAGMVVFITIAIMGSYLPFFGRW